MIRFAVRLSSLSLLLGALVFGVMNVGAASHSPTVKVKKVAHVGKVLVTPKGYTLYLYTPDPKNKSTCTGGCASAWPPLMLPHGMTKPIKPKGLKGKLSSIKRGHGRQVTFKGHPLYTYTADTKPGVATGQGVGGVWYAMKAG